MSIIKSMTGYGRSETEVANKIFTVELKGVNHRYLDVKVRLPRDYYYVEDLFKKKVSEFISRGRIDVYLRYDVIGTSDKQVSCDLELARAYKRTLEHLQTELKVSGDVSIAFLANQPNVLQIQDLPEDMDLVQERLLQALEAACQNLIEMRRQEGAELAEDMRLKLASIDSVLSQIKKKSPQVVADYQEKLHERIAELVVDKDLIDTERISMEVAVFADKSSIDEEVVRLSSHLTQFETILQQGGVVGRKLDFLIQEMNREINTIGSKANDSSISQMVVECKSELEKIREQVQNIE